MSDNNRVISSEYLRLRPLLKSDASLLYEWITDRSLVVLNSSFYPVSELDHESWFERVMTRRSDLVIFVIEDLKTGLAVGSCQLLNINWLFRSAELQIRIGKKDFQGRGFGSKAVQLLVQFGFKDLNLHRIYLHVFSSNERAINVYKKNGFVQEGVLKDAAYIDGEWINVIVMGLIKSDD